MRYQTTDPPLLDAASIFDLIPSPESPRIQRLRFRAPKPIYHVPLMGFGTRDLCENRWKSIANDPRFSINLRSLLENRVPKQGLSWGV